MLKRILVVAVGCALMPWNAFAQESKSSREPKDTQASEKAAAKQSPDAQSPARASAASSASGSAQADQKSIALSSDSAIQAELTAPLDARKNKEGDRVVARTTEAVKQDGQVVLPKGTRLIGHVTEAKARAKGETESALGIAFDRAILKNGQEMPLNVVVQAVAAARSAASVAPAEADMAGPAGGMASSQAGRSGGGLLSTAGSTVGGAASTVTNTTGAAGGAVGATANTATSATGSLAGRNVAGALTSSSTGVVGLQGLTLNSEAANATQGSLITSSTKNVHLDSGTRLLLHARGQ